MNSDFKVIILGGGLVGALAALQFSNRGYSVELYEKRGDLRKEKSANGKSINLALSIRGIEALKNAKVEDKILPHVIPMHGRFMHSLDGSFSMEQYDLYGNCINSVDRKFVNEVLLTAAEKSSRVKLIFDAAVEQCDFDACKVTINEKGTRRTVSGDLIIGADGSYSKVRAQMMRHSRMDFSQQYIDHGYVELHMPPTANNEFAMDSQHLHIWPRHKFMMIALPNLDKSFTVTLFMPWKNFDAIKSEKELLDFFEENFPDSIPLLGKEALIKDYFKNPKGPLMSVKCKPHNIGGGAVIVGDAAHAMVPFFGQGMNCGFEDILVLDEIFSKHVGSSFPNPDTLKLILNEYSTTRQPDCEAICDLALKNYITMRSEVVDPHYIWRKRIENFLYRFFPDRVVPLYSMVSFSRVKYSTALKLYKKRTLQFNWLLKLMKMGPIVALVVFSLRNMPGLKERLKAML